MEAPVQQSKSIEFADHSNDAADLLCPRCGGHYLHHTGVTMYECDKDDPNVTVIDTVGPTISINTKSPAGNPSSRRHGMVIKFNCELCSSSAPDDYIELAFGQHKGATKVLWRFSERTTPEQD